MDKPLTLFEDVTLLITHYNRSESLERLLNAFTDLKLGFGETVVSDDCSNAYHLNKLYRLQEQFNFKLVTTPVNGGLGHNINKGQDAVSKKYTVYIQEDFVPLAPFEAHFKEALNMMIEDHCWDLITFYSYVPYPYLRPYKNGFSEKIFHWNPIYSNNLKFYLYGDHPHLRKSDFFNKFGRYKEGINGDETEMEMSLSFIRNKGRSLFYNDHYGLLDQINSNLEPSTASFRKSWKQSKSPAVTLIRWFYLKYKFLRLNARLLKKQ
ncbi:glycosyltransferase involved in cell wall biosynthesis [Pedobacter sp. AK017]|uniref:glycosyltransferase family 2 protein n=1 Tax=Pedobacter sp. AK017 TaxID=2723073 RepID=UPI0016221D75|nr:glycosyltransferase [Pedobacter sp. AK017]MBB5436362.1 glycosyltransferase involved in cell wall biosynthesis [Pedobacter sp. AK017]